ncbi:hypothetical protein [Nocardioides sp. Soil774]|uniref:hypothetical protein n=1 Tax=Nocardioides sp. Soil774 TaxID=1736408 RepID=UPI0012FC0A64|nr:hypothetical protein [Nocardioides sp. Soil774]
MSRTDAARAAQEARDRTPGPRGSSSETIEAAMRRYLSAEQYHELMEDDRPKDGKASTDPSE